MSHIEMSIASSTTYQKSADPCGFITICQRSSVLPRTTTQRCESFVFHHFTPRVIQQVSTKLQKSERSHITVDRVYECREQSRSQSVKLVKSGVAWCAFATKHESAAFLFEFDGFSCVMKCQSIVFWTVLLQLLEIVVFLLIFIEFLVFVASRCWCLNRWVKVVALYEFNNRGIGIIFDEIFSIRITITLNWRFFLT